VIIQTERKTRDDRTAAANSTFAIGEVSHSLDSFMVNQTFLSAVAGVRTSNKNVFFYPFIRMFTKSLRIVIKQLDSLFILTKNSNH
jgi:hypothetical protein